MHRGDRAYPIAVDRAAGNAVAAKSGRMHHYRGDVATARYRRAARQLVVRGTAQWPCVDVRGPLVCRAGGTIGAGVSSGWGSSRPAHAGRGTIGRPGGKIWSGARMLPLARAGKTEPAAGFHGLEQMSARGLDQISGQRFRWSATDTVTWQISVPAGPRRLVQVVVPYVHEARHGFASACRVDIGGRSAPVAIRDSAICAEVDAVPPGPVLVTLRTPELLQPAKRSAVAWVGDPGGTAGVIVACQMAGLCGKCGRNPGTVGDMPWAGSPQFLPTCGK